IIISKIVEMAKAIDIKVICEGVETYEQVEFLKEIGCDKVQGYLFAKPMVLDEFEKHLNFKFD
ncbi:EAL domain-containing protein, partial [Clostridioides difficile]